MTDSKRIRVLLLEPDAKSATATREGLVREDRIELASLVPDLTRLTPEVIRSRPDVAVLDISGLNGEASVAVRDLLVMQPDCCVIVTGADTPAAVVSRAVMAGARGFLLKPFQAAELATAIREAYDSQVDLRRLQRSDRPAAPVAQRGQLIAVYSPKGGVGCTTIATNVAAALAATTKDRVGLVDLDLQFGDVGISMDLRGASSIVDLLEHEGDVDEALIDDVFIRHSSGVRVLLAPDNLGAVQTIEPDRVVAAIDALRDHFRYVICDLWSSFEELTTGVLRAADRVVLVTTPELPALKNVRRIILATTPILADERVIVAVNRHPGKVGIALADIERALGRPVNVTIPSEGIGVTEAINQGISLFDSRARIATRASRNIAKLAKLLEHNPTRQPIAKPAQASSTA